MSKHHRQEKKAAPKVLITYSPLDYGVKLNWLRNINMILILISYGLITLFRKEDPFILSYCFQLTVIISFQFLSLIILIPSRFKRILKNKDTIKDHILLKTIIRLNVLYMFVLAEIIICILIGTLSNNPITIRNFYSAEFIKYFEWFIGLVASGIIVKMFTSMLIKLLTKKKVEDLSKDKVLQKYKDYVNSFHGKLRLYYVFLIFVTLVFIVILTARWLPESFFILIATGLLVLISIQYSKMFKEKVILEVNEEEYTIPNYDEIVSNVNISRYSIFMAIYFPIYSMLSIEASRISLKFDTLSIIARVIGILISLYPLIESFILKNKYFAPELQNAWIAKKNKI